MKKSGEKITKKNKEGRHDKRSKIKTSKTYAKKYKGQGR